MGLLKQKRLHMVRFTKAQSPFTAGEDCGFNPKLAEALVKGGVAVYIDPTKIDPKSERYLIVEEPCPPLVKKTRRTMVDKERAAVRALTHPPRDKMQRASGTKS